MAIVVDANLLVALATSTDGESAVDAQFSRWSKAGEGLHAPSLISYEIASAFSQMLAAKAITENQLPDLWAAATAVDVQLHHLGDGPEVVRVASMLQRRSAYDAAYIALAQELDAELWTVDGKLARNAASADLPVRLVESS